MLDFQLATQDKADFEKLLAAGTATGWPQHPFRQLGNFVQTSWCSPGVTEAACSGGAVVNDLKPGTAWRQLSTLFYPQGWPQTFGIVWNAGDIPTEGLGLSVYYARNGVTVVGEGFGAMLLVVKGGQVVERASLGAWEIEVGAGRFAVPRSMEVVPVLLASKVGLVEQIRTPLASLRAQVTQAQQERAIQVWHEEPYQGNGIPPVRYPVAADSAEQNRLVAQALAKLDRQEALLLEHADWLYGELSRLLPLCKNTQPCVISHAP